MDPYDDPSLRQLESAALELGRDAGRAFRSWQIGFEERQPFAEIEHRRQLFEQRLAEYGEAYEAFARAMRERLAQGGGAGAGSQ